MKIVVVISGGCLQGVFSDTENIEATLIDWDNLKDLEPNHDLMQYKVKVLNEAKNDVDRTKFPYEVW